MDTGPKNTSAYYAEKIPELIGDRVMNVREMIDEGFCSKVGCMDTTLRSAVESLARKGILGIKRTGPAKVKAIGSGLRHLKNGKSFFVIKDKNND